MSNAKPNAGAMSAAEWILDTLAEGYEESGEVVAAEALRRIPDRTVESIGRVVDAKAVAPAIVDLLEICGSALTMLAFEAKSLREHGRPEAAEPVQAFVDSALAKLAKWEGE